MEIRFTHKLLFFIFIFNPCNSFIQQIYLSQNNKVDKALEKNLFAFGDIHLGSAPKLSHPTITNKELVKIHQNQALDIVNVIKSFESKDTTVILEDMFDCKFKEYQDYFTSSWERVLKSNFTNTLTFLNKLCKENNIKTVNVESRQTMILFFFNNEITAEEFLNNFYLMIDEIKQYNDNNFLNKIYKDAINNFFIKNESLINILKQEQNYKKNVEQILAINPDYMNNIKMFIDETNKLLDLHIVHEIYKHKDKKNIFLCVGSNHINRIKDTLNQLGFQEKYQISKFRNPIDVKPTLNFLLINNQISPSMLDNKANLLFLITLLLFLPLILKRINCLVSDLQIRSFIK